MRMILAARYACAQPYSPDGSSAGRGTWAVWVNTNGGVYHLEGERWFGRPKAGQYECEKSAKAEGDRETPNGQ